MKLLSLTEDPQSNRSVRCDVAVVGAGAAGIYLGVQLSRRGFDVVILEAGNEQCRSGESVGIQARLEQVGYRGATDGRFFGLGGTTAKWGGLVVSHSAFDLRKSESDREQSWRHIVEVVSRYENEVSSFLQLDERRDPEGTAKRFLGSTAGTLDRAGIHTLAAEFLPFRRKNLRFLFGKTDSDRGSLTVFTCAAASSWNLFEGGSTNGRVKSVVARSSDRQLEVFADSFVLSAGAIESTRILLEIDCATNGGLRRTGARIGEGLSDHLSVSVASVDPDRVSDAVRLFGPRFRSGRMRSFRFLEREAQRHTIPRSFAHFVFHDQSAGFELAKSLLQSLQARRLQGISPKLILSGSVGMGLLGFDRFVRRRLFMSREASISFQLDLEQAPIPQNRVFLGDECDKFGRPEARIDWRITDEDNRQIERAASRYLSSWNKCGSELPSLVTGIKGVENTSKPHDAYHPVGTCPIGSDPGAVVSTDLRVKGLENLYLASTAVFPSAGTANPTFSMLCLAHALVLQLERMKHVHGQGGNYE